MRLRLSSRNKTKEIILINIYKFTLNNLANVFISKTHFSEKLAMNILNCWSLKEFKAEVKLLKSRYFSHSDGDRVRSTSSKFFSESAKIKVDMNIFDRYYFDYNLKLLEKSGILTSKINL